MKLFSIALLFTVLFTFETNQLNPITQQSVLENMEVANNYLMEKGPNPGQTVTTNREPPSNLWTRATYYEGLMALHSISPDAKYYNNALDSTKAHQWKFRGREISELITFTS